MLKKLEPNKRTIQAFLNELSKDWDTGEIFEFRFLQKGRTPFTKHYALHALDEAIDDIIHTNNLGMNCYVIVNPVPQGSPLNACDVHIKRSFFAYVDADDKGAADRCRANDWFDVEMEVITGRTPHLRTHVYYRFKEPMGDMNAWRSLQELLTSKLGTDSAVKNPSRVMRIAGTVSHPPNHKIAKGYQTEVTQLILRGHYVE